MGQMGPGHMPNPGPFLVQPGFQGYQSEPPGPCHSWGNPKTYGQPDKNTSGSKVKDTTSMSVCLVFTSHTHEAGSAGCMEVLILLKAI